MAGKVGDFRITLQYKIEGSNSGLQYRSKVMYSAKWIVGEYQGDIDATNRYTGILYEERGRGILAERGQSVTIGADGKKAVEKPGDAAELAKSIHDKGWNQYVIEARGFHFRHTIN